jgi:ribose-phosphate pyrophosphokinase
MKYIFFPLPGNEELAESLLQYCGGEMGRMEFRHFPDGETYLKLNSDVERKTAVLICTLDHPDTKLLLLYFLCKTVKDLGADKCILVAPYLSYMRQDTRFHPGEAITSRYFAELISFFIDELITVDPHLHRTESLSAIYTIPSTVLHATGLISEWIKNNIPKPLLIGPDSESEQWVKVIAKNAAAPYIILEKSRKGDEEVEVTMPDAHNYAEFTPVLTDDIISTAHTMIETIGQLKKFNLKKPICIGIHGIFAHNAYENLLSAGADKIITTNSINHSSNKISINEMIAGVLNKNNFSR